MIVTANIQESHDASSSNVYVAHDEPCHKMNSVEKNLRTLSAYSQCTRYRIRRFFRYYRNYEQNISIRIIFLPLLDDQLNNLTAKRTFCNKYMHTEPSFRSIFIPLLARLFTSYQYFGIYQTTKLFMRRTPIRDRIHRRMKLKHRDRATSATNNN